MNIANVKTRPTQQAARSIGCPVEKLCREAAVLARTLEALPQEDKTLDDDGDCAARRVFDRLSDIDVEARSLIAQSEVGAAFQAVLLYRYGGLRGTPADPDGLSRAQRALLSDYDYSNQRTAFSILTLLLRRLDSLDLFTALLYGEGKITKSKDYMRAEFERFVKRIAAQPYRRRI